MPPIFWITGPPGAGKTTVSLALLKHFEFGYHVPVDELRKGVKSGLHESVNWTDETTRQFTLAEESACLVAKRYHDADFAVVIDHCRNLPRLDEVISTHLHFHPEPRVIRVCLLPSLRVNLARNRERTNKSFDPTVLDFIVEGLNPSMAADATPEWHVLDTTNQTVEETVQVILKLC